MAEPKTNPLVWALATRTGVTPQVNGDSYLLTAADVEQIVAAFDALLPRVEPQPLSRDKRAVSHVLVVAVSDTALEPKNMAIILQQHTRREDQIRMTESGREVIVVFSEVVDLAQAGQLYERLQQALLQDHRSTLRMAAVWVSVTPAPFAQVFAKLKGLMSAREQNLIRMPAR